MAAVTRSHGKEWPSAVSTQSQSEMEKTTNKTSRIFCNTLSILFGAFFTVTGFTIILYSSNSGQFKYGASLSIGGVILLISPWKRAFSRTEPSV